MGFITYVEVEYMKIVAQMMGGGGVASIRL